MKWKQVPNREGLDQRTSLEDRWDLILPEGEPELKRLDSIIVAQIKRTGSSELKVYTIDEVAEMLKVSLRTIEGH